MKPAPLTETCEWKLVKAGRHYYRKQCGGLVILLGKYPGLLCVCGKDVK